ncbi:MAG: C4-type zinc ribbon domain-containing protein [Deinococcaceae bacterium]
MTTMDFLTQLYRVQCMDLDLDLLKSSETQIPVELSELRAEFERLNNLISDALEQLDSLKKQISKNEQELTDYETKLERAKEEQHKNAFDVRTQTQYENLIQQLQDRIADIMDTLTPLYEERDAVSQTKSDFTTAHKNLRPQLDELESIDEQRRLVLRTEYLEKKQIRDGWIAELSARDRRQINEYEMIRRGKRDAMVTVQQERCTGCNMQLPTLILQKVASRKVPASKCPSCNRILIRL